MQIMSQYKIFVSVFWLLKLKLLRKNEDLFVKMLINIISQTNHKSSSVNHFCIRMNHWSQFSQVRIETSYCFAKKLLKFMMMIVDMLYKKWIK